MKIAGLLICFNSYLNIHLLAYLLIFTHFFSGRASPDIHQAFIIKHPQYVKLNSKFLEYYIKQDKGIDSRVFKY